MKELSRNFADKAMFEAAPIEGGITVHVVEATEDPVGSIAAACMMYEGSPVWDKGIIFDRERRHYLDQVKATHLKAPLEFATIHFLIEGVTRAFTHQMVRQRTAVFAQESMRFAVKGRMEEETPLPPSIVPGTHEALEWNSVINRIQDGYDQLIEMGVPAEDARGLLPHQTTTRLHYMTNLRNLADHAGNRLCTQAQFEWREVWNKMLAAMHEFGRGWDTLVEDGSLFRPVCYQLGHCPFNATFDRGCTIRDRVQDHAAAGTPSEEWVDIEMSEWAQDPKAAWVK